jgi:SEC-C motif-containing protein
MKCPCGTDLELDACCGPLLAGARAAATPEALMRSRYTAYAVKNARYIVDTHDPQTRDDVDEDEIRNWANRSEWLSLQVLATKAGGADDDRGEVEFIARFRDDRSSKEHAHHERSTFVKREGRWYYQDGETPAQAPVTRSAPKVGRNDPCPCGSGKKYKKCCGAQA